MPDDEDLDTTTPDQGLAMQLALQYFKIKSGFTFGEIASHAGIPPGERKDGTMDAGRHVNNFHTQGTCPYVMRLKRYLETQIERHEAFRHAPKYIYNIVDAMKGNASAEPESENLVDDVFSHVIEEGDRWKERVFQIYKGAWFIIRYAAGVAPGGAPSRIDADQPWTLYSIIDIQRRNRYLKNDLPSFTVHYRPLRNMDDELPRIIHGHILSLKGGRHMQFVGYEDDSDFPLIISSTQGRSTVTPPRAFQGFVLRRFEQGNFICGHCYFVRSKRTAEELLSHNPLGKIGIMSRSEIIDRLKGEIPTIEKILDDLRKSGESDGTKMLRL
jgi:hypothetical protein